jgi:hypothetical protein
VLKKEERKSNTTIATDLNGVGGFDIQSDGFTREGLDEDLHRHLVG